MNATDIIQAAKTAIKTFGTYSFDDKGPHEVMNLGKIVAKLRTMPAPQVAQMIREIADTNALSHERGKAVASALVGIMDDWDALFEEAGIVDLY